MKFELPAGSIIETDATDLAGAVAALASHPAMAEELAALAKGEIYERYAVWDDMRTETAGRIAEAFLAGGTAAAEELVFEQLVSEHDAGAENYFHEVMARSEEFARFMETMIEPIEEAVGAEREEIREALEEALRERVCEALEAADTSKPLDIVPSHATVELFRIFGADDGTDPEELAVSDFVSNVMSLRSVMPDRRLKSLFEGVNADFEAFAAHIRETQGVDLRGGPKDKALIAWLAQGDYIRTQNRGADDPAVRSDAAARAIAWKSFAPKHDPSLPSALTAEDIDTVLDNAGYGGLPCYVCRMPLAELLAFDWSRPSVMEPAAGRKDTGGFAGIYNPWNGSGHIEQARAPVHLPAGTDGWKVSGRYGRPVDETFGIVDSYYRASPRVDAPAPAAETEAAPAPRM